MRLDTALRSLVHGITENVARGWSVFLPYFLKVVTTCLGCLHSVCGWIGAAVLVPREAPFIQALRCRVGDGTDAAGMRGPRDLIRLRTPEGLSARFIPD